MKRFLRIIILILVMGIFLVTGKFDTTYSNNLDNKQYPIISKNELGPLPKNLSFRKEVDVNSDGRIDIIAKYSWGVRALYVNCGNRHYYRAITCNHAIGVESDKKNGWHSISIIHDNIIIDGQLYKYTYLPLEHEKTDKHLSLTY